MGKYMAKAPKNLQRGKGLGAYLGAPTKTISKGAAYGAAAGAGLAKSAGALAKKLAGPSKSDLANQAGKLVGQMKRAPSINRQIDRLIKNAGKARGLKY